MGSQDADGGEVVAELAQIQTYPRATGPLHILLPPPRMPFTCADALYSSLRPGWGREHGSSEEQGSREVNCCMVGQAAVVSVEKESWARSFLEGLADHLKMM